MSDNISNPDATQGSEDTRDDGMLRQQDGRQYEQWEARGGQCNGGQWSNLNKDNTIMEIKS